jgi:hypothetical protein
MASVEELIAGINPDLYLDAKKPVIAKFKELAKEIGVTSAIAKFKKENGFKPTAIRYVPDNKGENPEFFQEFGIDATHHLGYDSATETLEPIYFWILDLMNDFGLDPKKLIDNFSSSMGSGYFSEMSQRKGIMQQQGHKILGDINTVLRSVLNLVYDLKEMRIRLQSYEDLEDPDKEKAKAARLALKQIWMDKVDIQKGNSSIKALALGQGGFVTLIDAFLAVENEKDVKNLDLNERVKRAVLPRVQEFNSWIDLSSKELKSRYKIELGYLKAQVNSLKLYARWAKPYLKAAEGLVEKEGGRNPALVKTFGTTIFELTLLGKRKIKPKEAALDGLLPAEFTKETFLRTLKRDYYLCVLVDFTFRGIPNRVQQGFAFGGKVDVNFKAYALNSEEIDKLDEELDKSDLNDALRLVEGATDENIKNIEQEIDFFMEEEDEKEKKKKKIKSSDQSNPFLALVGAYDKTEKKESKKDDKKEEKKEIIVKKDSWIEKEHLRPLAAKDSVDTIFSLFDIYKKAHGMASFN